MCRVFSHNYVYPSLYPVVLSPECIDIAFPFGDAAHPELANVPSLPVGCPLDLKSGRDSIRNFCCHNL